MERAHAAGRQLAANLNENYLACISTRQFYSLPPHPVGGHTPECSMHLFIYTREPQNDRRRHYSCYLIILCAHSTTATPSILGEAHDGHEALSTTPPTAPATGVHLCTYMRRTHGSSIDRG